MNEQEMDQIIDALQRYFDEAKPDNDAHNAAISRAVRPDAHLFCCASRQQEE